MELCDPLGRSPPSYWQGPSISLRVSPCLLNHSGSPAVTWPSVAKLIAINRPSIFFPCPHPMVNLIYLERQEARAGHTDSLERGWFIRALGSESSLIFFFQFCGIRVEYQHFVPTPLSFFLMLGVEAKSLQMLAKCAARRHTPHSQLNIFFF